MKCVNIATKEFKELAKSNNVDLGTLEMIVHKYWAETKDDTVFPTSVYIQAQLGNVKYIESGENVRELWETQYKESKQFSTLEKVQQAANEALKFFPEDAVTYHKTADGKYVLSVKQPVKNLSTSTKEALKDSFLKNTEHFGEVSSTATRELLENIANSNRRQFLFMEEKDIKSKIADFLQKSRIPRRTVKRLTDNIEKMSKKDILEELDILEREQRDFELIARNLGVKEKKGTSNTEEETQFAVETKHSFTFNDGTTISTPFELNDEQKDALNAMDLFIHSRKPEDFSMTLSGYAGTGKTSIMEMLAEKTRIDGIPIKFTASTNKASQVLRDRVMKRGFIAQTLHRLFNYRQQQDETKAYDAKETITVPGGRPKYFWGDIVVIDEASMIDDALYQNLIEDAKNNNLKIIFVGDRAQLAPVNQATISKVFIDPDPNRKVVELFKVERTGDNAILEEATGLRNSQALTKRSKFNSKGQGVAYISSKNRTAIVDTIQHFLPHIKDNPDYFRILAWSNAAVSEHNETVRRLLGYSGKMPQVGEPMVGYTNWGWHEASDYESPYDLVNSEPYKVVNVGQPRTITKSFQRVSDGVMTTVQLQAIPLTLEDSVGERKQFNFIDVKSNAQNWAAAKQLALQKDALWKKYKTAPKGKKNIVGTKSWYRDQANQIEQFLFINDSIEIPDSNSRRGKRTLQAKVIDFGYAMTVHKSQGSTFTHVIMDDVNISQADQGEDNSPTLGNVVSADAQLANAEFEAVGPKKKTSFNFRAMAGLDPNTPETLIKEAPKVSPTRQAELANIRQQLKYVAMTRATDTVTVISESPVSEDSVLNHLSNTQSTAPTTNRASNSPSPSTNAMKMSSAQIWNYMSEVTSNIPSQTVPYTPKGKERQLYTVHDGHIFNKDGIEVFAGDSVDRNKILANLALKEGRAVEVTHKDHRYVVDGNKNITSVTTGKVMAWGYENGDRKTILGLAEQQFRSIIYNTQRSISSQLVTQLKRLGFEVYGKEALEQYLKEHPNAMNQQALEEQKEMAEIKAKAIADGTFMKAPNGKPTNLNEKQWLQTRTKPFRNWFGDWVTYQRIKNAKVIWGHPGTGKTWLFKQGRKDIIDFDSEYKAKLGDFREREVLKKEIGKEAYNQKLDELFEEARREAIKSGRKLLVSDLHFLRDRADDLDLITNISNEEFIERSHQRGEHDEADKMEWKNSINAAMQNISSDKVIETSGYISDLMDGTNVSKVVDENGEPLVVYHGTNWDFTTFKKEARGNTTGASSAKIAFFAASNFKNAEKYLLSREKRYEDFTNSRGEYDTYDKLGVAVSQNQEDIIETQYKKEQELWNLPLFQIEELKNPYGEGYLLEELLYDNNLREKYPEAAKKYKEEMQKIEDSMSLNYNPHVKAVFLNIKNIRETDDKGVKFSAGSYTKTIQKAQEENKDGGVIKNTKDPIDTDVYYFFEPNQIKSATDNIGTFSAENDDTQMAIGDLPLFNTSSAKVYGFVTKEGKIYLDETAISPEHPIHEYTHIWDRIVAQKNPKLWKRGVELMKELDLWKKIEENEHYGKKWIEKGITGERLENLIASEVHARLVGQEGEAILNKVAQKKGHEGIVDKLKNWMLDVWKALKGTFSNWSDSEIAKLTLDDFKQMTIRDFADAIDLVNAPDVTTSSPKNTTKAIEKSTNRVRDYYRWQRKHITFDKDSHTYFYDGMPIDYSVTEYKDYLYGKPNILGDYRHSQEMGNSVDALTRDFFSKDKDPRNLSYPNLNEERKNQIIRDLERLKKFFDKKFSGNYKVITTEFPIAGKIKTPDGEKTIAGTIDMLIIDGEGNLHILDMKVKKNSIDAYNDRRDYTFQLNAYRQLLETIFPEFSGKIKDLNLIWFDTAYPRQGKEATFVTHDSGMVTVSDDKVTDLPLSEYNSWKTPSLKSNVEESLVPLERKNVLENVKSLKEDWGKENVEQLPSPQPGKALGEDAEIYSGAAEGSDTIWANKAKELGINVKEYTVKDWDKLPQTWKDKLDAEYIEVVRALKRLPYKRDSYKGKLVRRDMMQADKADAIFAIGHVVKPGEMGKQYTNNSNHDIVDGGTGYAVQRGIIRGIPVYVFDQVDGRWKMWDKESNSFVTTSEPALTPHAATIGTREIEENGKQAIESVLNKIPRTVDRIDAIQKIVDKYHSTFTDFSKYGDAPIIVVDSSAMSDEELERWYKSLGEGHTLDGKDKKVKTAKEIREYLKESGTKAYHIHKRKETQAIFIDAAYITPEETEETIFHENIHRLIRGFERHNFRDATDILKDFWDNSEDKLFKLHLKVAYGIDEANLYNEYFTHQLGRALADRNIQPLLSRLSPEGKMLLNEILCDLGYISIEERNANKKTGEIATPEIEKANVQQQGQQPTSQVQQSIIQQHQGIWTRESAEKDPETLYIFTDNTDRDSGSGEVPADSWYAQRYGQGHHYPNATTARIRGLNNARPISTVKWFYRNHQGVSHPKYNRTSEALWHDKDFEEFKKVVDAEFADILAEWKTGKYKRIMFPAGDGLFNGEISAITKERTPKIYDYLQKKYQELQQQVQQQVQQPTKELIIVPTSDTARKAREIGGIDTLRHPDTNGMHFGNPFSHTNYTGVQRVVGSVKEASEAYEQWLRGEKYQDVEPERRRWILDQINSGKLDGKPLVYYTNKVPDNSYGRPTYDYNEAPNHAHKLQKLILEHQQGKIIGQLPKPLQQEGNNRNLQPVTFTKVNKDFAEVLIEHLEKDNLRGYEGILSKKALVNLAKTLFDFFEKNNIKIIIANTPYSDAEAEVKSSAVAIHGNYATIYYQENSMQGGKYLNILHELLHIATKQAMPFDAMGRAIEDENLQTYYDMFQRKLMEDKEWKDIQNFRFNPEEYNNKVSDRAKILAHALESAGEFVSSFVSNKEVQDVLTGITVGEVQTTSLWEEMRKWCKEMLAKIFHGNSFIMKEAVLDDITNFLLNTEFSATYDRPSLEVASEEEYNKYLQELEDAYNNAKDFKRPNQQPQQSQQAENQETSGIQESSVPSSDTEMDIWWGSGEKDPNRQNADLSNFAERPFDFETSLDDIPHFTSVEQAFQYHKLIEMYDEMDEDTFNEWEDKILNADAAEARRLGRRIPMSMGARARWDEKSSDIMRELLKASFEQNEEARKKLFETGNATLTHNFGTGKWKTEFPRLLMEVRDELREEYAEQAPYEVSTSSEVDESQAETPQETETTQNVETRIPVSLPNFANVTGIQDDMVVDAQWKVAEMVTLDNEISDENTDKENQEIVNEILTVAKAKDKASYKRSIKTQKKLGEHSRLNKGIDNLMKSRLLSSSEVRHAAEQVANYISDTITEIQKGDKTVQEVFPRLNSAFNGKGASRKDIVQNIGIDNFIQLAKNNIDPSVNMNITSRSLARQAQLLIDNWEALMTFATDTFVMNEGFGIRKDYTRKGFSVTESQHLTMEDLNQHNDVDSVREKEGDEQEHWQVEFRTVDAINSMSELVRIAFHECYLIDPNKEGEDKRVMSKWNIPERVDMKEAVQSVLKWTQGALTLDEMVDKMREHVNEAPWLEQMIKRLSDETGTETDFQSQFFGVMNRHFQLYSIVRNKDGKFVSQIINEKPALLKLTRTVESKYKMGEHPLLSSTGINASSLEALRKTLSELETLKAALEEYEKQHLDEKAELSSEDRVTAFKNLSAMSKLLGFDIPNEIWDRVINVDNIKEMTKYLRYIVNSLDKVISSKQENYDPFKFKGLNSIGGTLQNLMTPVADIMENTGVSSFFDDGKMYQSYVTPSWMTKLMKKFKGNDKDVVDFIMREYGNSEWYKEQIDSYEGWKSGWRNKWLERLINDPAAREIFAHKVELNFNKHNYMRTMTDTEYALSLVAEFFAEASKDKDGRMPAWFRIPMLSNKPSSEFIRQYAYTGMDYTDAITEDLFGIYLQELMRIQTVIRRNKKEGDPGFIKNFDTNGRKFCFLPFLNKEMENNTRLGYLLNEKIKSESEFEHEAELEKLVTKAIKDHMDERVKKIMAEWKQKGILKAAEKIDGIGRGEQKVAENIEKFLWNDHLASMNILQLTIGDIAFYKDAEDLQKRLAQIHAPGTRANIRARDYETGEFVSDGTYRTIILKDFDGFKSNIIANITEVFDRKIARAKNDAERKSLEVLKDYLVKPRTYKEDGTIDDEGGEYWKINVADAQGYSSPSSYRKKALMFGRWSREAEKIFKRLQHNDYDMTQLKTTFQPLKPFVYSRIEKTIAGKESPIQKVYAPFQAKNAEYLLVMAGAIIEGEEAESGRLGRPNLLKAIHRIMEESESLKPGKGIDTVQFESAIKSSLQTPIDIQQFAEDPNGEERAYQHMKNLIFMNEKDGEGNRIYANYNNSEYVHEASYEDYCLQQEVPEHFKDHDQAHGSQIRMIMPADLDLYYDYNKKEGREDKSNKVYYEWTEPGGKKMKVSATEYKKLYEETISANIEDSLDELAKELHLDVEDIKERNAILSDFLQREIVDSPRYGIDLFQACSLNENGEFRIPKGDPIQAKRIEQLINSLIKNRVNKQTIPGGPVVQVTNFGTSRQLHIRFKDNTGKVLMTEEEFNNHLKGDAIRITYKDYKEYLKKEQSGIAYFEVFAPIPSEDWIEKFGNPDGTIDIAAIEKIDPKLLEMVSYRIPTEDKYSCAPMKIVGFLPRQAGEAIMLPYELTTIDGSDFDVDKRYIMRRDIDIVVDKDKVRKHLFNKTALGWEKSGRKLDFDNPEKMKDFDSFNSALYAEYKKYIKEGRPYKASYPKEARRVRNNRIIDMSWAVLTHEMTADKILNPGNFEQQKEVGYRISAFKNPANRNKNWNDLVGKDSKALKKLSYVEKDLTWVDTQLQFYHQNNAGSSLIGVFAVNKVAHATLGEDKIFADIKEICGDNPLKIAGFEFKPRMEVDPMYDRRGNLIGKTLGSLVAASADTAKDPVLDLMNINMSTAGMLTSLLRLGMPFEDAAIFLSQDIITEVLEEMNIRRLQGQDSSLESIVHSKKKEIVDEIKEFDPEFKIDPDDNIHKEEITRQELINGLRKGSSLATQYKVLEALVRVKALADSMRNLTFATRFNSISSAVGPLIIDNIILEHKMDNLRLGLGKSSTGFYYEGGLTVTIDNIFEKHPILGSFGKTVGLAKNLFMDMPAGSIGFRNLLNTLQFRFGDKFAEKFYKDRKLMDAFSMFYQSYILVQEGLINSRDCGYYVNQFPRDFYSKDYKSKYPDNALIQAIDLTLSERTGRAFLNISISGMSTTEKERLSSAWYDLQKVDPQLSKDLFNYCFFRAGIGFSPKSFMSLINTYVKEELESVKEQELNFTETVSYVDIFRKLPSIKDPEFLIELFVRNNWNYPRLVKTAGGENTNYEYYDDHLIVDSNSDMMALKGAPFIKIKNDGEDTYTLWQLLGKEKDNKKRRYYVKIAALGENGEFLQILPTEGENGKPIAESQSDIINSLPMEDPNNSDLAFFIESDPETFEDMEDDVEIEPTVTEEAKEIAEEAEILLRDAFGIKESTRNSKKDNSKLTVSRFKEFVDDAFERLGITMDEERAKEETDKYC